jgi:hypothetical protein
VTVKAQIKNTSDKPVPVPPVRVKLLDSTLQEFNSVLMPSDGLVVAPHATRTLVFDVADPKNLTSSLDLDFDLVAMKKMKTAGPDLRVTPVSGHDEGAGHEVAEETAPEPAHETAAPPEAAPAHAEAADEPAHDQPEPALRSSLPHEAADTHGASH